MTEPSEPTPTEPTERVQVVQSKECARYTDPSQFDWFNERISSSYGTDVNLRFDPDGTTLRWFGYYVLPLGSWLVDGMTPITDEQLRYSTAPNALRPVPSWPAESTESST